MNNNDFVLLCTFVMLEKGFCKHATGAFLGRGVLTVHAQHEWGVVSHAASSSWMEFAKVRLCPDIYCMINFSSADASELHLFFDRANLIILSHQNKGKSKK